MRSTSKARLAKCRTMARPYAAKPTMRQMMDGVPANREQKLMAVLALLRGDVLDARQEMALGVDRWFASADQEQRMRAAAVDFVSRLARGLEQ